jgi:hypothetical protein
MSIEQWSEDVILVELPGDVEEHHELESVIRMLQQGDRRDVVVDFSHVRVVHGMWLARLLKIQRLAHELGHKRCGGSSPLPTWIPCSSLPKMSSPPWRVRNSSGDPGRKLIGGRLTCFGAGQVCCRHVTVTPASTGDAHLATMRPWVCLGGLSSFSWWQ